MRISPSKCSADFLTFSSDLCTFPADFRTPPADFRAFPADFCALPASKYDGPCKLQTVFMCIQEHQKRSQPAKGDFRQTSSKMFTHDVFEHVRKFQYFRRVQVSLQQALCRRAMRTPRKTDTAAVKNWTSQASNAERSRSEQETACASAPATATPQRRPRARAFGRI